MVNVEMFKAWLKSNTTYSEAVISDTISRVKKPTFFIWSNRSNIKDYLYRFAHK